MRGSDGFVDGLAAFVGVGVIVLHHICQQHIQIGVQPLDLAIKEIIGFGHLAIAA